MKKKSVLHGILLTTLILTGCGNGNKNSSSSILNSSSSQIESSSSVSSSSEDKISLTSISVVLKSSKTSYEIGEKFVTPVVKAHFDKKDDEDISDKCTYEGFSSESKGNKTITVKYVYEGKEFSTTYEITVTDITVDFETALSRIAKLQANELSNSNSAHAIETTVAGTTEDIVNEEITNYSDGSSSSTGTYTRKYKGNVEVSDTFKSIKTRITDKYRFDDDKIESYDMFVNIKDYKNDASTNYYYSDKVSKQFILNNQNEATEAGLSSDLYILEANYAANASANLTSNLYNFIGGYMYGNIYLETLGLGSIVETQLQDGKYEYSFNADYSYTSDGSKIKEEILLSYTLDTSKSKLLGFNYSYLVTEGNPNNADDSYTSGFKNTSTISYGEKTNEKTGVLNVDDYFVRTITEIKLKARNSRFDDVEVDPSSISTNYSYIFAYASKYYPVTAVDVELTAEYSTDSSVVALEGGKFKIMGEGSSTLYFSYYQKIDGIYELAYKTITVSISGMQVEAISFGTYDTNMYQQYGLSTSLTYDWPVNITPYKADTSITAVSSDESVLKVEIVREREVKIIPVGEGRATVTITSMSNPEATATKEFYVLDPNTDWAAYLVNTTFKHSSPYGYEFVMNFKADGTGTRVRTITETGDVRNDTFKYELVGNVIKFSNFSSSNLDDNSYVRGTIIKEFTKAGEPFGIYCETNAKGQGYYAL